MYDSQVGEHNSNVTMVYGTYNELVNGVYKPSYNWGAHIVHIYYYIIYNWNCASEHDVLFEKKYRFGTVWDI